MSDERFERDLTDLLREVAGTEAPMSLRYRLANIVEQAPLGRRLWFAPPLRSSMAVVAAIAIVVLAAIATRPPDVGPSPTQSPGASSAEASPTETPSLSPTAVSSPTPGPIGWSTLTWSQGIAMADGQFVSDLVPWGDGYVGVGGVDTGSGTDMAFFTSGDGIHWALAQRPPTARHDVFVSHLVRMRDQLLAVAGFVANGPGERADFPPPLWVSDDGVTWTQLHSPTWDAAFSPNWPAWLLSGPQGVLAVSSGTDPVVLFSVDGSTWTRSALPVQERAIAEDASAYSGGFVIVGRDGEPNHFSEAVINSQAPPGVGRPAAWISQDGVHWSESTVEGSKVAGGELRQVKAVSTGFLAVGMNTTADWYELTLTSWTSADGLTWSIAADAEWPIGAGPYPALEADGDRAVVFGRSPNRPDLAAWVTSDGMSWTRLAFEGSAPVTDCGAHPDCVRIERGSEWVVPDGVIVVGTPGGMVAQTFWFAEAGS